MGRGLHLGVTRRLILEAFAIEVSGCRAVRLRVLGIGHLSWYLVGLAMISSNFLVIGIFASMVDHHVVGHVMILLGHHFLMVDIVRVSRSHWSGGLTFIWSSVISSMGVVLVRNDDLFAVVGYSGDI